MRVDFREERKWKMTIAFALAHEAVEWHEAGDLAERVKRGICVLWKRPRPDVAESVPANDDGMDIVDDGDGAGTTTETPAQLADDASEESDDEQDREQQDVLNALDVSADVQHALEQEVSAKDDSQHKVPKLEEIDHSSALTEETPNTNGPAADKEETKEEGVEGPLKEEDSIVGETASGLKHASSNPVLGASAVQPISTETTAIDAKPHIKHSVYAPLRDKIAALDQNALFLDWDTLELPSITNGASELEPVPAPADLSYIFPELTVLGIPDVGPNIGSGETKKKNSKTDNRRMEETLATKLVPVARFMNIKPTLLGALEPAKHWYDGEWHDLDDSAVVVEFEGPLSKPVEDSSCSKETFIEDEYVG
jgi:chromatin modification-related protein VID21